MVKSYMGRQKVYCDSLERNDFKTLKEQIIKNIYRNVDNYLNSADLLNNYCKKTSISFHKKKGHDFLLNKFEFPKI